jgi:hypothetical protein
MAKQEIATAGQLGSFYLIYLVEEGPHSPQFYGECGFHGIETANIYTSNPDWLLKQPRFRGAIVVTLREAFQLVELGWKQDSESEGRVDELLRLLRAAKTELIRRGQQGSLTAAIKQALEA